MSVCFCTQEKEMGTANIPWGRFENLSAQKWLGLPFNQKREQRLRLICLSPAARGLILDVRVPVIKHFSVTSFFPRGHQQWSVLGIICFCSCFYAGLCTSVEGLIVSLPMFGLFLFRQVAFQPLMPYRSYRSIGTYRPRRQDLAENDGLNIECGLNAEGGIGGFLLFCNQLRVMCSATLFQQAKTNHGLLQGIK